MNLKVKMFISLILLTCFSVHILPAAADSDEESSYYSKVVTPDLSDEDLKDLEAFIKRQQEVAALENSDTSDFFGDQNSVLSGMEVDVSSQRFVPGAQRVLPKHGSWIIPNVTNDPRSALRERLAPKSSAAPKARRSSSADRVSRSARTHQGGLQESTVRSGRATPAPAPIFQDPNIIGLQRTDGQTYPPLGYSASDFSGMATPVGSFDRDELSVAPIAKKKFTSSSARGVHFDYQTLLQFYDDCKKKPELVDQSLVTFIQEKPGFREYMFEQLRKNKEYWNRYEESINTYRQQPDLRLSRSLNRKAFKDLVDQISTMRRNFLAISELEGSRRQSSSLATGNSERAGDFAQVLEKNSRNPVYRYRLQDHLSGQSSDAYSTHIAKFSPEQRARIKEILHQTSDVRRTAAPHQITPITFPAGSSAQSEQQEQMPLW